MRNGKTQNSLVRAALCVLASTAGAVATAQTQTPDQKSASEAVVKVTARTSQGASVGTGFAWLNPTTVVTAAHVIAGATQVTVYSDALQSSATAKVVRVNNVADLAMLQLDRNIGLVPARVAATVLTRDEHFVWGYPRDVNKVQGDDIRFSRSMEQRSTMNSIFKTEDHFKRVVGDQGFPGYMAEILRVSSIIQHGHSGAPIFDKAGAVVGVADGGLHEGTARINWAIPASTYLRSPDSFKDPPPRGAASSALMSAAIANPVEIAMSRADNSASRGARESTRDNSVLRLAWTASLFEIVSTMSEEDKESFADFIGEIPADVQRSTLIDVYEDFETGATIAVPHGMALTYDANQHQLAATSGDRRLQMIVRIGDGHSIEAAETAQAAFLEHLNKLGEWQADPDETDVNEVDEDGVEVQYLTRVQRKADHITGRLDASLLRADSAFLGSALVVAGDPSTLSAESVSLLGIMDICNQLSDFAMD